MEDDDNDSVSRSYTITPDGRHDTPYGEQRLFQAAIVQAFLDATRRPSKRDELNCATSAARAWFESTIGEDFIEVCDRAGFDATRVRSFYQWLRTNDTKFNRKNMVKMMRQFENDWTAE